MNEIVFSLCGLGLGLYISYLRWRVRTLEIQMEVLMEEYKKHHGG